MNQYLKSLWLTETVRLVEKDNGRFQDDDVNRQASAIHDNFTGRLMYRAQLIGSQYGLKVAQIHWLRAAYLSFLLLIILAVFSGTGIAFSALASNPINLYWAILCLLGVHFVMLLIWLLSWILLPTESGSFFIHLWSWLIQRFTRKNTVSQLLPAFITLFGGNIRWLIGTVVNFLWSVILVIALIVLVILLATKHYSFEWQTTLLSTDTVITITNMLGKVPAMLGFIIPDASIIRTSEQPITLAEVRSAWAVWLLGIFIVYGVFVRLGLLFFCWLKWRIACQRITLNTKLPEYQLLMADLAPGISKTIVDQETNHLSYADASDEQVAITGQKNMLVAIDIDESWSVPDLVHFVGFMNTIEQQKQILDRLQHDPAKKLLIAIDADRSPDRGITNRIKLLCNKSQDCRIWLINQGRQHHNWLDWMQTLPLEQANLAWLTD